MVTKMPLFCCKRGERLKPDSRRFAIGGILKLSSPSETGDGSGGAPSFGEGMGNEPKMGEAPSFAGEAP